LKTKWKDIKKTNSDLREFAYFRAEIGFRKLEKIQEETLYQLEIRRNPFRVDEKRLKEIFF
jgi:hypothetical protein